MNAEELKKEFKNRDRLIKVLSKDGTLRVALIRNTNAAKTMSEKHEMAIIPSIFTSRAMSAASLMAAFLKGEERIAIHVSGNGPLQSVYAEAMSIGEIRAFARYDNKIDNITIAKVADFFKGGLFKVSKFLYDRAEPQTGIIPLRLGDISSEFEDYLNNSEQIASAAALDVELENNSIAKSGGILIQALPGVNEQTLYRAFDALQDIQSVCSLFTDEISLEEILKSVLPFDFDVIANTPIDFYCRCSKDNFMAKLLTLRATELKDMRKKKQNELICQFCNAKYYLQDEDFDSLIETASAKSN